MHSGKELSGTTWLGASEYSICGWFKVLHFTEKLNEKKEVAIEASEEETTDDEP
jgi:hypothetical protein